MNMTRLVQAALLFAAGLITGKLWPELGDRTSVSRASGTADRNRPVLTAAIPSEEDARPMVRPAKAILAEPKTANRRAALYRALAELTPDNWEPMYQAFMDRKKQGCHDDTEWELFLNALGAVDGQRAMLRLMKDIGKVDSSPAPDFHYILRTWVPANYDEALAWNDSLPKGPFRDGLWSGFVGGMAELDLDAAIRAVEAVEGQYRGYFLYDLVPRVFQQRGLEGGEQWLNTVVEANRSPEGYSPHVMSVFSQVSGRMIEGYTAAGEPLRAVEWLAKHSGQPYFSGDEKWKAAAKASISHDPRAAMDKFLTLEGSGLNVSLGSGILEWMRQDGKSAKEWLAKHQDNPHYDKAAEPVIQEMLRRNDPEARQWVDSLADPNLRASYSSRIGK